jgi:hypothetical protein
MSEIPRGVNCAAGEGTGNYGLAAKVDANAI